MDYSSFTNTSYQIYQLPSWNRSHDIAVISTLLVSLPLPLVLMLLVFVPLVVVKLKGSITTRSQPPLPPGPIPWPIIGNPPEIWQNKPVFRWILGLMKQLGTDIACIRLGHVHVIAVTSPEIAREFLKKHDSVFASRPKTMAAEYATRGFLSTALVPWGDQWKKMRKVMASNVINPARLSWLLHKRTQEADNLVRFIYNQCINHENLHGGVINLRLAVRQYTGNAIRRMMFNTRYFGKGREDGGPGYEEEQHVESLFTVLMHLNSFILSDYVPWLRPLDLEGHEKIVSKAMRIVNGYHDPLVDERIKEWGQGKRKEPQDLLDAFILAKDLNGKPTLSAEEIKAQITELMLAAVDNPANAAEWAMAEMLNNPEILRKATDEIDSVVGKSRLVEETDIPKLNYIKCCAREAFRLHTIAPFNVPHVSNADTTVAGYFIPKGSCVLISRRGLDPKVWEEPLEFKPERHLKDEWGSGGVELTENELRFISFGTGRRGCIGVGLGSAVTIMLFARLIQGFTWEVPPNGTKIDLSESKDDTLLAKPLHALAKPRLSPALYTQL
ncbi:phenylalanine N-monooxygenase-like isoform X1 [Gossypium arboreum]|uniref:Phenylalanine N-monooxygenase-like n=1 Tax=Gossypium arboreum TaxID=29729 RepID=A0ABR0NI58_GOSAR|nr:phenylalanine N-monooxygenase-like isoform X1 [Gossypium arboreum]KAK5794708.1 hypothetical protein PVK06_035949 [Gossypium arboreum]